jgi:hypothetical protein
MWTRERRNRVQRAASSESASRAVRVRGRMRSGAHTGAHLDGRGVLVRHRRLRRAGPRRSRRRAAAQAHPGQPRPRRRSVGLAGRPTQPAKPDPVDGAAQAPY